MARGIFLAFLLTTASVILQILMARIRPPRRFFNFAFGIYLLSIPLFVIFYPRPVFAGLGDATILGLANGLLVHLLLFFNYMQGIYYFTRPVTLRILIEFLQAKDHYLTRQTLQDHYHLKYMIGSRFDLLVVNGYLLKQGERFELTAKGRIFSSLFLFLRNFFGVPYYLEREPAR